MGLFRPVAGQLYFTPCTGGWVGPSACLNGCGKRRPTGIFCFSLNFRPLLSIVYFFILCRHVTYSSTTQNTNIHASGGIRTCIPSRRSAADPRLRPLGHWDRLFDPRTIEPVASRCTNWAIPTHALWCIKEINWKRWFRIRCAEYINTN